MLSHTLITRSRYIAHRDAVLLASSEINHVGADSEHGDEFEVRTCLESLFSDGDPGCDCDVGGLGGGEVGDDGGC